MTKNDNLKYLDRNFSGFREISTIDKELASIVNFVEIVFFKGCKANSWIWGKVAQILAWFPYTVSILLLLKINYFRCCRQGSCISSWEPFQFGIVSTCGLTQGFRCKIVFCLSTTAPHKLLTILFRWTVFPSSNVSLTFYVWNYGRLLTSFLKKGEKGRCDKITKFEKMWIYFTKQVDSLIICTWWQ